MALVYFNPKGLDHKEHDAGFSLAFFQMVVCFRLSIYRTLGV